MNDNYIVLNDTVKLFYEDGFHVMADSELAKLRSPWQGPMQGLSDPARHIMITVGWKPVGNVLSMLLKPKDIAKKMESDIRKAMKAYDYRPQGFLTKEIAGQKAEGGGGLFSSAKDFIKFYQMLGGKGVGATGKRILSEKAVEIASSKQTGEGIADSYGFGIAVSDESFGHGGAYGTQGVVYRDSGIVAVYMVAVAGVPKQGEAQNTFRRNVEALIESRNSR